MKLVLYLNPNALEFTEPGAGGPYPWLERPDSLRLKARAGHVQSIGSNETPSLALKLLNHKKKASNLLGRLLRVRAEVYDDDDTLFFTGVVQSIGYGRKLELNLES